MSNATVAAYLGYDNVIHLRRLAITTLVLNAVYLFKSMVKGQQIRLRSTTLVAAMKSN